MTAHTVYPVAVIGGGIIGLSTALQLQAAGEQVILLERGRVCGGASSGNAGHLATEQVFPVASPDVLKQLPRMLADPLSPLRLDWRYLPKITPWFVRLLANMRPTRFAAIVAALQQLNHNSLSAWQAFSQRWQLNDLVKIKGSLLVAERPSSIAALQQHGQKLQQLGVDNRLLDSGELHEREPRLSPEQLGGLFFPDTGHIVDLDALAQRLLAAFRAAGGCVREQFDVCHSEDLGDVYLLADAQRNSIRAKHIVLACGAFSRQLVRRLGGADIPLDTERGYHLMLPNMRHTLSVPVSSFDRKFIMTPMQSGLRLAGTVEYAGLDAAPNMIRAQQLKKLAVPMLSLHLDDAGETEWMGFRPTLPDSLPIIDRKGRVLFALGHQHLGLTQAALTAQWIQALYFKEPLSADLSPYRLNRF